MTEILQKQQLHERTFVLAYPCHHTYRSVGEIVFEFEKLGLDITEMGCMHVNKAFAQKHVESTGLEPDEFALHPFRNLAYYLASKPVVAMIVEGKGAILKVCALISDKQPPFWFTKGIPTVYASPSDDLAKNDIERWFQPVDLKEMKHSKKVVCVLPDELHGPWDQVKQALEKDCFRDVQPAIKDNFHMEDMRVFLINPLAFKEHCVGYILEAIENNCAGIRGIKLVKKEDCPSKLWTSDSVPSDRGVAVVGYLVKPALNITSVDPTVKRINYSEDVFEIGSNYVRQNEPWEGVLEHATNFFKSGFSVWACPERSAYSLDGCMFEASLVGLVERQ
ncbi:hypothetical protein MKX03_019045 [Papaver bracteatum]|nr:hypothetical protein MKX03_019045 [Papaver bracteatum]